MKEVTYEEWIKNPTPRMMWVWDNIPTTCVKRKVVYFSGKDMEYPVIAVVPDETGDVRYKHCAEIEKQRRMTNKELARWQREKPTREYKDIIFDYIFTGLDYREPTQYEEVSENIRIREDDGEWREPLVEIKE